MRTFFLIQVILTAVGGLFLTALLNWHAAASFTIGGLIVLGNVSVFAWVWRRVVQKKLVALSVALIVFKYAILGAILYLVLKTAWVQPLWFCIGLGTLLVAAIGTALISDAEGDPTCLSPGPR
jgi:hypothetical protein